jgi:ubiquinone biosynthesis protein
VWRVARTVAATLPRYLWLLARDRHPRTAAGEASWSRAHAAAAARIEALALDLGGLFVKVAQIVGARADVFPAPFLERLRRFHDDVPPRPFAALRPGIEHALGAELEDVFRRVEERPLAAASLAQVHGAELLDGSRVVIKIQYPEIARLTRVDLGSARRVAGLVGWLQNRVDFRSLAGEITRFVELELDFEREVESTERVREAFSGNPEVRVPRVHKSLSRGRLIVLERLHGIRVTDLAALRAAGYDPTEIARRISRIYSAMMFEHDFFQGDPHPGNLLVLPGGVIGLLDFGLSKELPRGFARRLAGLIVSAMGGDPERALAEARELGFPVAAVDPAMVPALIGALLGQTPEGTDLAAILGQKAVARIPEHFPLLARTLILLNGLSHVLAPDRYVIQQEMLRMLSQTGATPGRAGLAASQH